MAESIEDVADVGELVDAEIIGTEKIKILYDRYDPHEMLLRRLQNYP